VETYRAGPAKKTGTEVLLPYMMMGAAGVGVVINELEGQGYFETLETQL